MFFCQRFGKLNEVWNHERLAPADRNQKSPPGLFKPLHETFYLEWMPLHPILGVLSAVQTIEIADLGWIHKDMTVVTRAFQDTCLFLANALA